MSYATKVVLGTIGISFLLGLLMVANLAVA